MTALQDNTPGLEQGLEGKREGGNPLRARAVTAAHGAKQKKTNRINEKTAHAFSGSCRGVMTLCVKGEGGAKP